MALLLDRAALGGLTLRDRELFQRFGVGDLVAPRFRLLHEAFEVHAWRSPNTVAVTHEGESVSYGELNARADRLAWLLVKEGVRPGDRVGLFLQRGIPMIVGILATLKAGAAYVPQDPRIAPAAGLAHIIATANTQVILTITRFADRLPPLNGHTVICLDNLPTSPATGRSVSRRSRISPTSPAVVIFTSGTTGRPNGVAVTHANLCNVVTHGPATLGVRAGMRVAQLLNIAFDMALWEIFLALSHGAELVIRGSDIEVAVRDADVVIATPSVLAGLDPGRCRNVRIVAVAGERCPQWLAESWSTFARFHNACGPTEVTIVNTLQAYRSGGALTIGAPLPNTTVYVLDENLRPCPIGEVGEMWAGGACVSQGYLGNDELIAARYLPDPFLGGAHRMFRTRDLGCWTVDGQLEHHGRTDDQVKLRGFRVELDGVTAALERTPGCQRAATVLHRGELVGFVSPAGVDPDTARRTVGNTLPYYCVPSTVVPVDTLPVTSRGKVDKRALVAELEPVSAMAGAVA